MPIGVNQYQILTPEQANPFQTGYSRMAEAIYHNELARQTRANAIKQENLNPNVQREQMAEILKKEIENKYLPEDYRTTFDNRRATTRHLNTESDFIPLESYIKANTSLRANTRFGKNFELIKALNSMDQPSRSLWQSQHPAEWAEMLSDLANGQSAGGRTDNNDNEAEQLLKNELRRMQAGNINRPEMANNMAPSGSPSISNVPMNTDNMSRHDVIARANADQQAYDQRNNIPVNQPAAPVQPNNVRTPINQAVIGTLPLDDQPKSDDPLIAAAQEKLINRRFESTPDQVDQLKNSATQNYLLKNASAVNRGRLEGAKVAEIFLQENRTPEIIERIKNTAKMAGQTGQARMAVEAHLPESMQSQAFKDSKWFHTQFVSNMSNVIKQMEKLTGDQKQRDELHRMMKVLSDPDLGPKGALQAFNRAIGSLQDMSESIFNAVETKDTKGFFRKMYGLPGKYKEYIPSEAKESKESKSDIDAKIADLDRRIKAAGG